MEMLVVVVMMVVMVMMVAVMVAMVMLGVVVLMVVLMVVVVMVMMVMTSITWYWTNVVISFNWDGSYEGWPCQLILNSDLLTEVWKKMNKVKITIYLF